MLGGWGQCSTCLSWSQDGCCPQSRLCFPVEAWRPPLGPRPLGIQVCPGSPTPWLLQVAFAPKSTGWLLVLSSPVFLPLTSEELQGGQGEPLGALGEEPPYTAPGGNALLA